MQLDDFYILIDPISEVEAKDVVDFKRSKVVAKLTPTQYEDLIKKNQSRCNYLKHLSKKLTSSKPKPKPTSLPVSQKKHLNKQDVSQSKTKQHKFILPLTKLNKKVERTICFKSKASPRVLDNQKDLQKPVSSAISSQNAEAGPVILPKAQKLIDLIPPDVDVFGLDMEQLYLNTPETDESDYDSVSYFGSDDSY